VRPTAVGTVTHNLTIVCNQHNRDPQRWREKAVDDGRQDQRADGVYADEVDGDPNQSLNDDHAVEKFCLPQLLIETIASTKSFSHGVRVASREDRNGEEAAAD